MVHIHLFCSIFNRGRFTRIRHRRSKNHICLSDTNRNNYRLSISFFHVHRVLPRIDAGRYFISEGLSIEGIEPVAGLSCDKLLWFTTRGLKTNRRGSSYTPSPFYTISRYLFRSDLFLCVSGLFTPIPVPSPSRSVFLQL